MSETVLAIFVRDRLSEKGGQRFTRISAVDVRYLFQLYDDAVFDGQLANRLKKQSSTLKFHVDDRNTGIPGEIEVEDSTYTLIIAPRILLSLERGGKTRLHLLDETIKHQLIHLAMLLWNYYGREPLSVFGGYGTLFECMMKEYFPEISDYSLLDAIVLITPYLQIAKPLGAFENWENSCYLDSVLMVLFECASDWWRKNMLERIPSPKDEFKGVCDIPGGSPITTPNSLYDLRLQIRDQLRQDYAQINDEGEVIMCTNLRGQLQRCLPGLKEDEKWELFNAGALYDLLASLFPALQLNIPVEVVRWNPELQEHEISPPEEKLRATIPMWDFMDPNQLIEEQGFERILWDSPQFNSEVLVLINGGVPRVKIFSMRGQEKGFFYINGQRTNYEVTKARAFGMTILSDTYRLIGVVTLQGVSPTQEGGSHYISYFLSTEERWYRYNDLTANAVEVFSLPNNGVWEEKGGEMPAMYFYQRVSTS